MIKGFGNPEAQLADKKFYLAEPAI